MLVNCENCQKELERRAFCSGACKVAHHRKTVTKGNKQAETVTQSNEIVTNGYKDAYLGKPYFRPPHKPCKAVNCLICSK